MPRAQISDPSSCDGVGAKLGVDATVPLSAPAGKFTRIHVPGEELVDLAAVVDTEVGSDWRRASSASRGDEGD